MCSIKSGSIETVKYKKCVIMNMISKTTDNVRHGTCLQIHRTLTPYIVSDNVAKLMK